MRRRLLASVGGKALPYLRRVAWLKSDGNQWIDSGIILTRDTLDLDIMFKSGFSTQYATFGMAGSYGEPSIVFGPYTTWNGYNAKYPGDSSGATNLWLAAKSEDAKKDHNLHIDKSAFTLDEVEYPVTMIQFTTRRNLYIFCRNLNGKPNGLSPATVYHFKNGDGFDLIPVLDMHGRPCFYNQAPIAVPADDPSRFFYNQGTGEFTWGELDAA